MGPRRKRLEKTLHVFMHKGVMCDAALEIIKLMLIGEFTINKEKCNF
jgi:hypothetical protein